jgi:hypothetical protein
MSIIEQLNGLMPQDGESGDDVAQVHLNVRRRTVELAAGTVAEELFLPGEPWPAADDRRQERELASLITSSRESREAYIAACRVEVRSILQRYDNVVRSLAAELLQRRTMTGEEIDMVISRAIGERQLREEHQRRIGGRRPSLAAATHHVMIRPLRRSGPSLMTSDRRS